RSAGGLLHARLIARLDAPDQPPDDARGGDFGFEAADLPVVLALDRIQREPGDGGGAPMAAVDRAPVPHDAADRVVGHAEEDDVLETAADAEPRLGDGGRDARRARGRNAGKPFADG